MCARHRPGLQADIATQGGRDTTSSERAWPAQRRFRARPMAARRNRGQSSFSRWRRCAGPDPGPPTTSSSVPSSSAITRRSVGATSAGTGEIGAPATRNARDAGVPWARGWGSNPVGGASARRAAPCLLLAVALGSLRASAVWDQDRDRWRTRLDHVALTGGSGSSRRSAASSGCPCVSIHSWKERIGAPCAASAVP